MFASSGSEFWGGAVCRHAACKHAVLLHALPASFTGVLLAAQYGTGEVGAEVIPSPRVDYRPEGVPKELARDFQEALQCAADGLGYGAALVGRRVLQAAVRAKGGKGRNLEDEIDSIGDELGKSAAAAAHQVRFIGNDAAHADEVTVDDVDALLNFTQMVLQRLFIDPAAIAVAQEKRPPKEIGTGSKKPAAP